MVVVTSLLRTLVSAIEALLSEAARQTMLATKTIIAKRTNLYFLIAKSNHYSTPNNQDMDTDDTLGMYECVACCT